MRPRNSVALSGLASIWIGNRGLRFAGPRLISPALSGRRLDSYDQNCGFSQTYDPNGAGDGIELPTRRLSALMSRRFSTAIRNQEISRPASI